jgi:hypothetical protein
MTFEPTARVVTTVDDDGSKHVRRPTTSRVAMIGVSGAILTPIAMVGGMAASSPPAAAAAEGCSPPTTFQETYFQVCLDTGPNSQGTYIDDITSWGSARIGLAPAGSYHIELVGPSVPANFNGPTSTFTVLQAGTQPISGPTWSPNKNVTSGQYCAILWYHDASGAYSNEQEACISVS